MASKDRETRGCTTHKLVVDVAVFAGDRIAFVKYRDVRRYDGQRGWFLPDDFLDHLEHPDDAARRVAEDQLGIPLSSPRLDHVESFGDGAWHLIFHYRADLSDSIQLHPGSNVAAAEWFVLSDLPERSQVAHDGWAIDVLERIRKRKA